MKLNYECHYCKQLVGYKNSSDGKYNNTAKMEKCPVPLPPEYSRNGSLLYPTHCQEIVMEGENLSDDQRTEIQRIKDLSNEDLFGEYVSLIPGDDYDGCFTSQGEFTLYCLDKEIRERLKDWFHRS